MLGHNYVVDIVVVSERYDGNNLRDTGHVRSTYTFYVRGKGVATQFWALTIIINNNY